MQLAFTKMHGLGNDFIVFDAEPAGGLPSPAVIRRLADRRRGIGFDQALVMLPPRDPATDVYYRIFNADGSEVEQCGNGARCVARLIASRMRKVDCRLRLDSPGGVLDAWLRLDGTVCVGMGMPNFEPASLPLEAGERELLYRIETAVGSIDFGAVSLGNPHAVIRVRSVDDAPVDTVGPAMENHPHFPQRVNVGFLEIVSPDHIRLRVFERGVGETQACGTGACAAVAVGRLQGVLSEDVAVDMPGGRLRVQWPGSGEQIWLIGPAETAFEGQVEIPDGEPEGAA
jgi:diaminopimelate epimerase